MGYLCHRQHCLDDVKSRTDSREKQTELGREECVQTLIAEGHLGLSQIKAL